MNKIEGGYGTALIRSTGRGGGVVNGHQPTAEGGGGVHQRTDRAHVGAAGLGQQRISVGAGAGVEGNAGKESVQEDQEKRWRKGVEVDKSRSSKRRR